jgi:hypothetical protein
MVRAILEGRKTQTRRVIKPQQFVDCSPGFVTQHYADHDKWVAREIEGDWYAYLTKYNYRLGEIRCPYGVPGDRLYVREATMPIGRHPDPGVVALADGVFYKADYFDHEWAEMAKAAGERWQPSIHMKRKHSRITLEVKRVWVERVQEISRDDAIAEGVYEHELSNYRENRIIRRRMAAFNRGETDTPNDMETAARFRFAELWDSINAANDYGWAANPWVWCVEIERVEA